MATPGRKASWTRPASLYEALDNGFRWCADPATLQRICNRLGARDVHTFFWRWFHRLPSPFTADDLQAGYAYELAFRQFEVSDTRVFDRPQAGRAFFEGVIRDHLDLVRPAQVVVIFDRKLMPRTLGAPHGNGDRRYPRLWDWPSRLRTQLDSPAGQPSGDLRSSPTPPQGPHHSAAPLTSLPTHPIRPARRRPVHQGTRPSVGARSRSARSSRARRSRRTQPARQRLATTGPRSH